MIRLLSCVAAVLMLAIGIGGTGLAAEHYDLLPVAVGLTRVYDHVTPLAAGITLMVLGTLGLLRLLWPARDEAER